MSTHTHSLHPETADLLEKASESYRRHRSGLEVFTSLDRLFATIDGEIERNRKARKEQP